MTSHQDCSHAQPDANLTRQWEGATIHQIVALNVALVIHADAQTEAVSVATANHHNEVAYHTVYLCDCYCGEGRQDHVARGAPMRATIPIKHSEAGIGVAVRSVEIAALAS